MSKKLGPEAGVKRAICDLLDVYHIPYWRMNAGDRFGTSNGKTWRIKGHDAGTADILAAPIEHFKDILGQDQENPVFFWIEAKRPNGGKQSEEQKEFQRFVESQGHIYILATSGDDVLAKLRELGCIGSTEDNPKPMMHGNLTYF